MGDGRITNVFISYDHEDHSLAAPIAATLEKAGHSVWWDERIAAGAEYNMEIEVAVDRADAVIVLWSERSVRSAWVRDEAAEGRDKGKLIPVTVDGTKPPMGFRQFQTIDLSKRKSGGGFQNIDEVIRSVGRVGSDPPAASKPLPANRRSVERRLPAINRSLLIAMVLVLIAGAGLIAWRTFNRPSLPIVAVVAADDSAHAQQLARNLLVKLGSLQSAKTDAMRLMGAEGQKDSRATLIFETSGTGTPHLSKANLALLAGTDRSVLWSKDFRQEGNATADLEQQMAYTAGHVLDCAVEASKPGREKINQDTLKLFLNGCSLFAEKYRTDPRSVIPIFQQIVQIAPSFEPAWRKLLLAEALEARTARLLEKPAPPEIAGHIAVARKLRPEIPEMLVAESMLVPITAYARRSELLERAVQLDADNPDLLLMRAEFNLAVGRMADVIEDATRAVELNPLSPGLRSHMIVDLAYSGRLQSAQEELRRAEQLWPQSPAINDARFRLSLRYGDPNVALALMRTGSIGRQPMISSTTEAILIARANPTIDNVQRAIATVETHAASDTRILADLVQAWGEFHRENELFQTLLNWKNAKAIALVGEAFFRPPLARFRQDVRFMQIADRAGLVDYWLSSEKWPDFCAEPDLSYDCKEVASSLRSAR